MDMNKQKNLVIGLAVSLLLIIFVLLNTEPVTINFLVVKPKLPLIVVLVIMACVGALVSWLMGEKSQNDQKGAWGFFKKKNDKKINE